MCQHHLTLLSHSVTHLHPPPHHHNTHTPLRDPFVLEKPCSANEWRWRVMVGSNISTLTDHTDSHDIRPDQHSHHHQQQQQQLEEEGGVSTVRRELLRRASSSSSSSLFDVHQGMGHHISTRGTATVYRSKTQELEGGKGACVVCLCCVSAPWGGGWGGGGWRGRDGGGGLFGGAQHGR
jgi:hypothetical protein